MPGTVAAAPGRFAGVRHRTARRVPPGRFGGYPPVAATARAPLGLMFWLLRNRLSGS